MRRAAFFKAELYLVFRQKRTYYGLAAIFIIELFIVAGSWYQGSEIIEVLLENLTQSFYLEGELLNGNLVLYIVLNSLWFNLPLILMIVVSGFVTNDYKDRIIQLIVMQSFSKLDYIIVKYFVAIVFTLIVLFFLIASSSILAYTIFGNGDLITYLDGLNFFESDQAIKRIGLAFFSGAILMVVYSIVSISFAVIFKEITITWIVCALFLILNNLLLKIDISAMNHWFFPKLIDTWQYFFYYEIPLGSVYLNHTALFIYMIIFMAGGIALFNKRDLG